jgi:uncharacterized protein
MLIKPHTKLEGPQLAGWTPRATSPADHGIRLDANVAVPLPDGTRLRADVYRPREPGRYPALVAWSAYPRYLQTTGAPLFNNEAGVVGVTVARGYAHVIVDARGINGSGGTYDPWFSPQEQRDMADAIAWVAAQPWCDGSVGMIGISYFAMSQVLAAAQRPPALRAIFPYDFSTDLYRHVIYHGGLVNADFDALYAGVNGDRGLLDRSVPPVARHAVSYLLDRAWVGNAFNRLSPRVMRTLLRRARTKPEYIRTYARIVADGPYGGPWYDERSSSSVLPKIRIPACIGVTQASVSLHQFGPYEAWHRMTAPRKLFIAPPDVGRPWKTFHEELLAWYDHHLKGIDNGYDALPPVRYWLQGANRWRQADDWPLPDAEPVRLYPAPRNTNAREAQPLRSTLPPASALSYLAIPRSMPYPRELDRHEAQVLRFVTEAFAEDTEMAGPITLSLRVSSTAIDTYITARLSDLAPDGGRRMLSFGYQRAAIRQVDDRRSTPTEVVHKPDVVHPLKPGEPVTLRFSLTVSANLFAAGHRLLLEVGSRSDRIGASLAEGFIYFDLDAPPYPARNTVYAGEDSFLEIATRRWRP